MKTELSLIEPSQVETECLVAVVLDHGENSNPAPAPTVETSEKAVAAAAADLLASGEVTGKIFETTLVHRPQGLKAKRLLLIGGGRSKNFSGCRLRKSSFARVSFPRIPKDSAIRFAWRELPLRLPHKDVSCHFQ